MSGSEPFPGAELPPIFVTELLGIETDEQVKFTAQAMKALSKIGDELVPRLNGHPLRDYIVRGLPALDELLDQFDTAQSDQARALALDAVAEIIQREHVTGPVLKRLEDILSSSKSEVIVSMAAKAIAVTGDDAFMEMQREALKSKSPSAIRAAAKLLGFGRYKPAARDLLDLLGGENLVLADALIWALGEMQCQEALPTLHQMLESGLRSLNILEALGKIAGKTSVMRIVPLLSGGNRVQREKAAQALSLIVRKNNGLVSDPALAQSTMAVLEKVIDHDDNPVSGFFAIVTYSLLGGQLSSQRMLRALGGKVSEEDMGAMAAFFVGRPGKK